MSNRYQKLRSKATLYSTDLRQAITNQKLLFVIFLLLGFLSALLTIFSLKLAIARFGQPQPQAILILGGSPRREIFAARFAVSEPSIPIWLSSGSNSSQPPQKFHRFDRLSNPIHLDRRATDTVTNFTTLVDDFKQQEIQHLYLVTSDYHMARAAAIATIVLGSRGITFTPLKVTDRQITEPSWKTSRDIIRALVWLFTGYTGTSWKRQINFN